MTHLKRRRPLRPLFVFTCLGLLAVVVLATTAAARTISRGATAKAPAASGTLTVWAEDYYVKIFQPLIKPWENETGIKVTFVTKDFNQMSDQFVAAVPTGAGPDIFITPSLTAKFVKNGVVAPVDLGAGRKGLNALAIDAFSSSGTMYGVPFDVENIALYRNTALAPKAPRTFDQAIKSGKALIAAGKAKTAFGIGLDPKSGNPYLVYPLETSFGGDIFGKDAKGGDDPKKLRLDDAAGLKFAAALSKWGKTGALSPNLTLDIALTQFTSGKMPYYLSGPWDLTTIQKSKVKYAISAIPSAGSKPAAPFAGFYGVVASAKAKNPLAANLFLTDFMLRKATQVGIWKEGKNLPALKAAASAVSADPDVKGFATVAKVARPTPTIPAMDQVWGPWGETEMQILRGQGGDPRALWKKMARTIRANIAKG